MRRKESTRRKVDFLNFNILTIFRFSLFILNLAPKNKLLIQHLYGIWFNIFTPQIIVLYCVITCHPITEITFWTAPWSQKFDFQIMFYISRSVYRFISVLPYDYSTVRPPCGKTTLRSASKLSNHPFKFHTVNFINTYGFLSRPTEKNYYNFNTPFKIKQEATQRSPNVLRVNQLKIPSSFWGICSFCSVYELRLSRWCGRTQYFPPKMLVQDHTSSQPRWTTTTSFNIIFNEF